MDEQCPLWLFASSTVNISESVTTEVISNNNYVVNAMLTKKLLHRRLRRQSLRIFCHRKQQRYPDGTLLQQRYSAEQRYSVGKGSSRGTLTGPCWELLKKPGIIQKRNILFHG